MVELSRVGEEVAADIAKGAEAPGLTVAQLDARYQSIPRFEEWAGLRADNEEWKARHDRIVGLAEEHGQPLLARSLAVMRQLAALETGALEDLYEVDRGVTISVAAQAATWQAVLDAQPAKPMIEAQVKAYEFIMDLATGTKPVAEAWIRELHAVICAGQPTYTAYVGTSKEQRPLPLGKYKTDPNHVQRSDGTCHAYCPVERTAEEMAKLIDELREPLFLSASPALQAAYAHYAFVAIHPFQDGNGRVARALASVYSYKAARVPLMILSESKTEYLDALEEADANRPQQFCTFIESSVLLALELVEESMRTAAAPSVGDAARQARNLYKTRGGYLHDEVDQAGRRVFRAVFEQLTEHAKSLEAGELSAPMAIKNASASGVPDGYRHTLSVPYEIVDGAIKMAPPAEARFNFSVWYFVPRDAKDTDVVLVHCRELGDPLQIKMSDATPKLSIAAQARIGLWAGRLMSAAVSRAQKAAEQAMRERGY